MKYADINIFHTPQVVFTCSNGGLKTEKNQRTVDHACIELGELMTRFNKNKS